MEPQHPEPDLQPGWAEPGAAAARLGGAASGSPGSALAAVEPQLDAGDSLWCTKEAF